MSDVQVINVTEIDNTSVVVTLTDETVQVNVSGDTINVQIAPQPVAQVKTVGIQGIPGAQGPQGLTGPQGIQGLVGPRGPSGLSGAAGLNFTQTLAATTWTISHNLGYIPAVMSFSVGGVEMVGTVINIDSNNLQIQFNEAVAGSARLI